MPRHGIIIPADYNLCVGLNAGSICVLSGNDIFHDADQRLASNWELSQTRSIKRIAERAELLAPQPLVDEQEHE